jgi:hypothetical protein
MELLPFQTLFAIAAGALILSITVASSMSHRADRRVPVKARRTYR